MRAPAQVATQNQELVNSKPECNRCPICDASVKNWRNKTHLKSKRHQNKVAEIGQPGLYNAEEAEPKPVYQAKFENKLDRMAEELATKVITKALKKESKRLKSKQIKNFLNNILNEAIGELEEEVKPQTGVQQAVVYEAEAMEQPRTGATDIVIPEEKQEEIQEMEPLEVEIAIASPELTEQEKLIQHLENKLKYMESHGERSGPLYEEVLLMLEKTRQSGDVSFYKNFSISEFERVMEGKSDWWISKWFAWKNKKEDLSMFDEEESKERTYSEEEEEKASEEEITNKRYVVLNGNDLELEYNKIFLQLLSFYDNIDNAIPLLKAGFLQKEWLDPFKAFSKYEKLEEASTYLEHAKRFLRREDVSRESIITWRHVKTAIAITSPGFTKEKLDELNLTIKPVFDKLERLMIRKIIFRGAVMSAIYRGVLDLNYIEREISNDLSDFLAKNRRVYPSYKMALSHYYTDMKGIIPIETLQKKYGKSKVNAMLKELYDLLGVVHKEKDKDKYINDIFKGFEEIYELLGENREILLGAIHKYNLLPLNKRKEFFEGLSEEDKEIVLGNRLRAETEEEKNKKALMLMEKTSKYRKKQLKKNAEFMASLKKEFDTIENAYTYMMNYIKEDIDDEDMDNGYNYYEKNVKFPGDFEGISEETRYNIRKNKEYEEEKEEIGAMEMEEEKGVEEEKENVPLRQVAENMNGFDFSYASIQSYNDWLDYIDSYIVMKPLKSIYTKVKAKTTKQALNIQKIMDKRESERNAMLKKMEPYKNITLEELENKEDSMSLTEIKDIIKTANKLGIVNKITKQLELMRDAKIRKEETGPSRKFKRPAITKRRKGKKMEIMKPVMEHKLLPDQPEPPKRAPPAVPKEEEKLIDISNMDDLRVKSDRYYDLMKDNENLEAELRALTKENITTEARIEKSKPLKDEQVKMFKEMKKLKRFADIYDTIIRIGKYKDLIAKKYDGKGDHHKYIKMIEEGTKLLKETEIELLKLRTIKKKEDKTTKYEVTRRELQIQNELLNENMNKIDTHNCKTCTQVIPYEGYQYKKEHVLSDFHKQAIINGAKEVKSRCKICNMDLRYMEEQDEEGHIRLAKHKEISKLKTRSLALTAVKPVYIHLHGEKINVNEPFTTDRNCPICGDYSKDYTKMGHILSQRHQLALKDFTVPQSKVMERELSKMETTPITKSREELLTYVPEEEKIEHEYQEAIMELHRRRARLEEASMDSFWDAYDIQKMKDKRQVYWEPEDLDKLDDEEERVVYGAHDVYEPSEPFRDVKDTSLMGHWSTYQEREPAQPIQTRQIAGVMHYLPADYDPNEAMPWVPIFERKHKGQPAPPKRDAPRPGIVEHKPERAPKQYIINVPEIQVQEESEYYDIPEADIIPSATSPPPPPPSPSLEPEEPELEMNLYNYFVKAQVNDLEQIPEDPLPHTIPTDKEEKEAELIDLNDTYEAPTAWYEKPKELKETRWTQQYEGELPLISYSTFIYPPKGEEWE